jgi:hypothetical protein
MDDDDDDDDDDDVVDKNGLDGTIEDQFRDPSDDDEDDDDSTNVRKTRHRRSHLRPAKK